MSLSAGEARALAVDARINYRTNSMEMRKKAARRVVDLNWKHVTKCVTGASRSGKMGCVYVVKPYTEDVLSHVSILECVDATSDVISMARLQICAKLEALGYRCTTIPYPGKLQINWSTRRPPVLFRGVVRFIMTTVRWRKHYYAPPPNPHAPFTGGALGAQREFKSVCG
jgi:hypothetical protein